MNFIRAFMALSILSALTFLVPSCSLKGIEYVVLKVELEGKGKGSVVDSRFGGIDCEPDCQEAYSLGTDVLLKYDSLLGSKFEGWGGACKGMGQCRVKMDEKKTVTASFGLPDRRLTVRLGGTGTGTVTSNPPGIFCGFDCGEDYPTDRHVALEVVSGPDSKFTGWAGACEGMDECRIKMDAEKVAIANFERQFHSLTVANEDTDFGSVTSFPVGIDCGSDCERAFVSQTLVRLTPTPISGSVFLGWDGDCVGLNECELTMNSTKAVSARFARKYRVTVNKTGVRGGTILSTPAGISCGSVCDNEFAIGGSVALVAVPDPGAKFIQWSGDCTGSAECTLDMTQDRQVTAEFGVQYVGVSVTKQGVGQGTVVSMPAGIDCGTDCQESFPINSLLTVTASAGPESEFVEWLGACGGTNSTCTISLSSTVSIFAEFSRRYPLSISLGGAGTGRVTGDPGALDCSAACQ